MRSGNSIKLYFILFIFLFSFSYFAQEYTTELVNKSPLYATASILFDYDDDGDLDIIITKRRATNDPGPSSVEWLENDGSKQFPRTTLFEGLSSPLDLDLGDFNNDGKIDYVVSDKYVNSSSGALVLALNQGGGNYMTSYIEDSIRTDQSAVSDFNKDGNLDIVSVGFNRSKVTVYWNDGNLNFTKQDISDSVIQVSIVEVNDIDNDGDEDIIYGGGGLDGCKILYNNGTGVFDSAKTLFLNNGQYSNAQRGMTIVDLNNDGEKDILAFSGVGFGGLYFLDGSNEFNSSIIDIDGIDLGGDIVAADVDGNGFKDIIRQNSGDDYLSILYQVSDMDFQVEILELNWDNKGPGQMSLGDLDTDGDIDLVFPENGNVDGDISWFENIDGRLYRHYLYSEIEAIRTTLIVDLDGDEDLDLIVTAGDEGAKSEEDEIIWFENINGTSFIEHRIDDDISFPGDIKVGDLNADGSLEIIATANEDSSLVWYIKSGPQWLKIVVDENLVNPLGCELTDIDSDGDLDIILCSSGENKIVWYENNGSGIFSRRLADNSVSNPQKIISADFNNDETIDFAVICADTNNTVLLYKNDGNENFEKSSLLTGQKSFDIEIVDWNKDGALDIILGFDKGVLGDIRRDVAVLINDGNAEFTDSTLIILNERTFAIEVFDADNDDDLDIALGSASGISPIKLGLNENGAITSVKNISNRNTKVFGMASGDINGDGIIDLAASDQFQSTNNLLLFLGDLSTKVENIDINNVPNSLVLYQNYPNPFNPRTKITYQINYNGEVTLEIFDIIGRKVKTLVNEIKNQGIHTVTWNGRNDKNVPTPSGIYFYTLRLGENRIAKKMLMLK